jgi:hypothetical protein
VSEAAISVRGLRKSYGDLEAAWGAAFRWEPQAARE